MNEDQKKDMQQVKQGQRYARFAAKLRASRLRDVVLIVLLLVLGAAAAVAIVEPWLFHPPTVEEIQIEGITLKTGNPRPEALLKLSRERLQSPVKLVGPDVIHTTNMAELGATVDLPTLDRILMELAEENSPTVRHFYENAPADEIPIIGLPISLDSPSALESLVALKASIDRAPKNARFDFESGSVIEEAEGLSLDVYGTLERLDRALVENTAEIEMVVRQLPSRITQSELSNIKVDSVIGFFETRVSRLIKDKDRTHNVLLGAARLNGQIIMPGQVFSFNDVLGDRGEARGFRYAPVIAGGVLVEGMGGGTCQVASTLNAAAFFAGLVVVDRRPHSRPSSYIKLGLDATVSYPDLDLKLKNPFDFPVVIHFGMKDGILRAEFRGKTRPYTVTFLRKIIRSVPFPVRIVENSGLAKGKEVITQNGIPGYTVRRYQIIDHDKVAYRFQTLDKYPPTIQIVHRGTAPSRRFADKIEDEPKPDTHSPYRASNYLRMVQGKDNLWYEQSHE